MLLKEALYRFRDLPRPPPHTMVLSLCLFPPSLPDLELLRTSLTLGSEHETCRIYDSLDRMDGWMHACIYVYV